MQTSYHTKIMLRVILTGEDKSFNYSAVIVPETLIFLDEAVVTIMKFRTSKKMEAKVPGGCRGKISAGIQVPL